MLKYIKFILVFLVFTPYFGGVNVVRADTCNVTPGSTSVYPVPYAGIYILGPNNNTIRNIDTATSTSFVDGYGMRSKWANLDTGTTSANYVFQNVIDAINGLQLSGKKLSLTIDASEVPVYVLNGATYTYNASTPTFTGLTALPWDSYALSSYQIFIDALSNLQVCDHSQGIMVSLKNHPAFSDIRIGIIGAGKLRQSDNAGIFTAPSYSRSNLQSAVLAQINDVKTSFPNTTNWVAYFSISDSTASPTLDSDMIGAISPLHTGFFQELLKGDSPSTTGINATNLLLGNSLGGFSTFQACGTWTIHSLCTFTSGDDSPINGLSFGYGTFGARYYEIYKRDITNPLFSNDFQIWHNFLQSPDTVASPEVLSLTLEGDERVHLSWNDLNGLESGYIIERAPTSLGSWTTVTTTTANQIASTDSPLLPGTYFYRVHGYNSAGSLVLSNSVTTNVVGSSNSTLPQNTGNVVVTANSFGNSGAINIPEVTPPNSTTLIGPLTFQRDLTIGSVGDDVKILQEYLNDHDFILAPAGARSPGNETTYFGYLTKIALSKFQKASGISPAVGYFGPLTRAYIESHP